MKSMILKTTTLALGAMLLVATGGAGTAEAHSHGYRGHYHGQHYGYRHYHRPTCQWVKGDYGRIYRICK